MPGTVTLRPITAKLGDFSSQLTDSTLSKVDPYCVAIIGHEHAESTVCKQGGKNPTWSDALLLNRLTEEPFLFLEVKDKSLLRDKTLGVAAIDLEELRHGGLSRRWYELFHNKQPAGGILVEASINNSSTYDGYASTNYTPNGSVNLEETRDGKEIAQNIPETLLRRTTINRPYSFSMDATNTVRGSILNSARDSARGSIYSQGKAPENEIVRSVHELDRRIDVLIARSKQTESLVMSKNNNSTSIKQEGVPKVPVTSNTTASHRRFSEDIPRVSRREQAMNFVQENYQKGVTFVNEKVSSLRKSDVHERPVAENRQRHTQSERKLSKERFREFGQKVMIGVGNLKESSLEAYENLKERISTTHGDSTSHSTSGGLAGFKDKVVGKIAHLGKSTVSVGTQTEESYEPYEVVIRRDLISEGGISRTIEAARERLEVGVEKLKYAGEAIKDTVQGYSTMEGEPMGRERKRDMARRKMGEGMENLRLLVQGIVNRLNDHPEHHEELRGFEGESRQMRKREILRQKFSEGMGYIKQLMESMKGEHEWGQGPHENDSQVQYNDLRGHPRVFYDYQPTEEEYFMQQSSLRQTLGEMREGVRESMESLKSKAAEKRSVGIGCGRGSQGMSNSESFAERLEEGIPVGFTLEDQHLDKGEVMLEKMPGRASWAEVDRLQDGRKLGGEIHGAGNVFEEKVGVYQSSLI